ncbi:AraC family transcriptional regulator [Pendulispora brunnea]|uniref:AraC family transcriptional regulator n=1 Tax=Pendulispora brunnea TaxID=2905690 RepID=A0ABZ2KNK1_9BACT
MQDELNEARALVLRHVSSSARAAVPIPRVAFYFSRSRTEPSAVMYEPALYFVLQGAKRLIAGDQTLDYRSASFLLVSIDLPVTGHVTEASPEEPYLAVRLALDLAAIAALLLEVPAAAADEDASGFGASPLTDILMGPLLRLVRLADAPGDVAILAPMIEREILYRVLQGARGAILRQIAHSDSRLSQISRALKWIRSHFDEPLRVETLAGISSMSASSFHRHFKAVTGMSPLAYQKEIRLHEARRRLVTEPGAVASVAFSVGYESASQFSREYARQFGLPPARDAARLRQSGS